MIDDTRIDGETVSKQDLKEIYICPYCSSKVLERNSSCGGCQRVLTDQDIVKMRAQFEDGLDINLKIPAVFTLISIILAAIYMEAIK